MHALLDRCGTCGGAGVDSLVDRVVLPSPRLLDAKLPPFVFPEQLLLRAQTRNLRGEDHVPAREARRTNRQSWDTPRLSLNASDAQRLTGMDEGLRHAGVSLPVPGTSRLEYV